MSHNIKKAWQDGQGSLLVLSQSPEEERKGGWTVELRTFRTDVPKDYRKPSLHHDILNAMYRLDWLRTEFKGDWQSVDVP
jgi:hypothetical protein